MADISLTGAVYLDGPALIQLKAGATIAATDMVYIDNSDGSAKLATANAAASAAFAGVSVNGSVSGNPINVAGPGTRITVSGLTKGVAYYLSATAGKICPFADLTSGKYVTLVGIADSATVLYIIGTARGITI